MRIPFVVIAAVVAIGASGCGASRSTTIQTRAFPTLTSATATFVSTDHGKDKDSAVTAQVLRSNAELGAEIRSVGTEFNDNSSSGPLAFSLAGPFMTSDVENGQIRLRLTPDGDDDWTFDLHIAMRFSDGTARNFMWQAIRLDHTSPERVLTLGPARS
ncbi:MAG: hypothetical protein HW394_1554 [Acidobacteria bacterium]|nr:hypothetical protein [Acidobacteriota bacterium]